MRLLSYNIHKGIGGRDRVYRLERIIGVIRQEDPDLICLQEVDCNVARTRHDDQPRRLAEELHANAQMYQLNVKARGEGGYGNLLLSRWPIRQSSQVSLRLNWRKPRGAQLAVIETPEGPMHLVHWHLGLAERERRWQVKHLLANPTFQEFANLPTMIVGDFNDWLNTLARWSFKRHGFSQITAPRRRFRSFPAVLPVISLDKVFVRGAFEHCQARIVRSRLTRDASDHLPVVVDFHLKPVPHSQV
jgi:endonuclease/exonuclease/phosphatase family metal-dependent hydrolase